MIRVLLPSSVRVCFIITAFTAALMTSRGAFAQGQTIPNGLPVIIENPSDFDRINAPVASGIAVPESLGVTDPNIFMLVDETGTPIPAQFKVLSRWRGERDDVSKPEKWVLVMLQTTVPAHGSRTYWIVAGNSPQGQLVTTENPAEITIQTGPATFVIDKADMSLFKSVNVGSSAVVASPGEIRIKDTTGNLLATTVASTIIEETGHLRSIVRQKGSIPSLGLDLTLRYTFWSGSSEVKLDFRVENNGSYGEMPDMGATPATAYFKEISLALELAGSVNSIASAESSHAGTGQSWGLSQDFGMPANSLDMLSGFSWAEMLGNQIVGNGDRHSGTAAIGGPEGGIAIAIDRFWQNFPKAFRGSAGTIEAVLFPEFGFGPVYSGQYSTPTNLGPIDPASLGAYRFEGGRWKTHTVHYDFGSNGAPTSIELDRMGRSVNKPLMLRPQHLFWNFRAWPFGQLVVERRDWPQPSQNRYERMLDVLVDDDAADSQPALGKIGFPAFRARGGTYGGGQFFGWQNYGDIIWGDGYSSLHYDMPFGVLLNWYRTGDYEFFDIGRDMAAHRRDYDQYHSQMPGDSKRGGQFYEKGWTHGNYSQPTPSHTWVHGMLLYYVMTGDEGSREAALEVGEFIMNQHPENWDGFWGSRILGWQLEGLCDLYNYLGDDDYLSLAQATAQNWANLEQQNGGGGFVVNLGYAANPHAQTWMQMIVFNALAKYFYVSSDFSVLAVMDRMASWYLAEVIHTQPMGPVHARPVGKVWRRVAPGYHDIPSVHHGWVTVEALANATFCLGRFDCFNTGLAFWESMTRFHQASAGDHSDRDYANPATFSPIAYRMFQYPNSESKIHSNLARWGHAMLALTPNLAGY